MEKINDALNMIAEHRKHQIDKGYTLDGDDKYTDGQLALAAVCYALPTIKKSSQGPPAIYPWVKESYKPSADSTGKNRILELVKAAALIVAEIERLQRYNNDYTGSNEVSEGESVCDDPEGKVQSYEEIP